MKTVADVKGVKPAGLLFDAGPLHPSILLDVRTRHAGYCQAGHHNQWSDPANPTSRSS